MELMTIQIKTPEEIEIMKEGGKRHAEILNTLSAMVAPGVTTLELEEKAMEMILEKGDKPSFLGYKPWGADRPYPAALCVSINDEIVHGIPNEEVKIIKEGDIVSLDLGVTHKGLITDAAITIPAGKIDQESMKLIETCRKALIRGCEAVQPGGRIGDIGFAISEVVKPTGFSLAKDLVGHGVGYEVHEDPFVPNIGKKGKGEELRPGMVLALEPMVNAGTKDIKVMSDGYTIKTRDGRRSAHFEHTVAITEKGHIILTL